MTALSLAGLHLLAAGLILGPSTAPMDSATAYVRANQVGYLPDSPKVAVVCALSRSRVERFSVVNGAGQLVFGPARARREGGFGPCVETYRLDFSGLRSRGEYRIVVAGLAPVRVRIGADLYRGAADTLLYYLRQQRSGFNPLYRLPVHTHTDAILVDHPEAGRFIPVAGGWADAADYLQYVTTSATATFDLLMAVRDHPAAFADRFGRDGLPGSNGVLDALDEARHGLEWLIRMYPEDDLLLNQLGDDRDHQFLDLPPSDSSDYGWGRGRFRPVYPCTGRPQGLLRNRNHATGLASTAGKFASAMALGARLFATRDSAFAALLAGKATSAYELGRRSPGACQTAPGSSPYYYEEESWADDMELGAAELFELTREERYLREGLEYAEREPVTPWMGQDTARHYQWYPFRNSGHFELARSADAAGRQRLAGFYRTGLERVASRAKNGFRVGIPFIWCSNDLMSAFATQALLYRRMTGDERFREYEQAALDWLLGTNPWGVSMIIGYPANGRTPLNPHSVVAHELGVQTQTGGLVDGPVYRSIYSNLLGIRLTEEDEFAAFNTGSVVYHDDFGDYSTNEPILDGTASLSYLFAALGDNASIGGGLRP